jgi:hypothetical protein
MLKSTSTCTPLFLEHLTLVANNVTESLDILCCNGDIRAIESLSNTNRWEGPVVTEPEVPIEVLDAQVPTICDSMDQNRTKRMNIVELHG